MKMTRDIHDIVGGLLMSAAGLFFALPHFGIKLPMLGM